MNRTSCLACEVNAGRIQVPGGLIYGDRLWVVDHAIGLEPGDPIPLNGFLIVCPVRHVEHVHHLTDEEQTDFGLLLADVAKSLDRVLHPEKIHFCSFGEIVKHVHWYVIPRMAGMPTSGSDLLHGIFREKRWTCTPEEAAETAFEVGVELEKLVLSRNGGPF